MYACGQCIPAVLTLNMQYFLSNDKQVSMHESDNHDVADIEHLYRPRPNKNLNQADGRLILWPEPISSIRSFFLVVSFSVCTGLYRLELQLCRRQQPQITQSITLQLLMLAM